MAAASEAAPASGPVVDSQPRKRAGRPVVVKVVLLGADADSHAVVYDERRSVVYETTVGRVGSRFPVLVAGASAHFDGEIIDGVLELGERRRPLPW